MKKQSLKGRVAVITGAGRGIGLATARALRERGALVAIADIDEQLAVQAAQSLGGFGGKADVRDRASFAAFLAETERALEVVDILVNNAGIMPAGAFTDESDAISDTQIDINLRGVIHGCKQVLPGMVNRGRGHIVNVASMAGVLPVPGLAVYCATKFAVVGLTQSLREEYRDSGVSFSTIMPSKVRTELAAGTDDAARGIPAVGPEDVAAAVVDALEQRLTEVAVPRYLGAARAALGLTPHRIERGVRRLCGDRRVLEKIDQTARAGYNARITDLTRTER